MNDIDQIAAEAAREYVRQFPCPSDWGVLEGIIKSAIEKALEEEKQRNFDAEKELRDKARARIDELKSQLSQP